MNQAAKTYVMQFSGAMVLYVVMLILSVWGVKNLAESPLRIIAALLPIIPISLGLLVFLRFFGSMDELQKRIQLYAMAFSFGATGLLTFTYGLLQNAGLPQVSFIAVFPVMLALWGLGSVIASWRYQ
jgi:hypothetical protein